MILAPCLRSLTHRPAGYLRCLSYESFRLSFCLGVQHGYSEKFGTDTGILVKASIPRNLEIFVYLCELDMALRLQAEMRTIVASNVSMQFSASSSRRYLEQVRFIAIIGFLWPQLQYPSSRVPHFKVFYHSDETPPLT